jgi:hypothetical protein
MSKAITIRFKLHGAAADLARALSDHLRYTEHIDIELDEVVKRQFIGWMQKNSSPKYVGEEQEDGQLTETALQSEAKYQTVEGSITNGSTETVEAEAVSAGDQPEGETASTSDTLLEAEEASPG